MISTIFLKVLKVLVNFFDDGAFYYLLFCQRVPGWQFDALGSLLFLQFFCFLTCFYLHDHCFPRVHFHGCYGHF